MKRAGRFSAFFPASDGKYSHVELAGIYLDHGTRTELLSVGLDKLTTDVDSFEWLRTEYGHLLIYIVVIVASDSPVDDDVFPVASNGICYGVFELTKIVKTLKVRRGGSGEQDAKCMELIRLLEMIRACKRNTPVPSPPPQQVRQILVNTLYLL